MNRIKKSGNPQCDVITSSHTLARFHYPPSHSSHSRSRAERISPAVATAELAETRLAGGYPAFHGHIEPYLAVCRLVSNLKPRAQSPEPRAQYFKI
jgi:hypothetical protein